MSLEWDVLRRILKRVPIIGLRITVIIVTIKYFPRMQRSARVSYTDLFYVNSYPYDLHVETANTYMYDRVKQDNTGTVWSVAAAPDTNCLRDNTRG